MSASPANAPWYVRAARYTLNWDPRILYALFGAIVLLLNMDLIPVNVALDVQPSTQAYFDAIEALPRDKIAVIDVEFGAGNLAECGGQLDATIRHLMARGVPVAMWTWVPNTEGQKFAKDFAARAAEQMGKEYGVDYCVFAPVMPAGGAPLSAFARDIPGSIKQDYQGAPLGDLPMMKNVRDVGDVSLIARVAYFWELQPWIGFVQGPFGTKLAIGSAAITSSTAYPFLNAGQLCGLLAGAPGAAQYEQLVEAKYGKLGRQGEGMGTRTSRVQSFVSAFVVLIIIVGNIAHVIDRRRARQEGSRR